MKITNFKMDYDNYCGLECTVPCDMYSVLLNHGYIDDPYYGTNEEALFEYSKKDCTFYTEFALSENELKKEKIDIIFYGLDTICDIYVNGRHVAFCASLRRLLISILPPSNRVGQNRYSYARSARKNLPIVCL